MSKKYLLINILFVFIGLAFELSATAQDAAQDTKEPPCEGKMLSPADICWTCWMPATVGGQKFAKGRDPENGDPKPAPVCNCIRPPIPEPVPGVSFTIWEPARVIEVVRKPLCSPTLNGAQLGSIPVPSGTNSSRVNKNGSAFYHVHHYFYPYFAVMGILEEIACLQSESMDLAYMTEFDLLWDDDQLAALISPESFIFANPIAQLACAADAAWATAKNFGTNQLFWCSGAQGSLYPLGGTTQGHVSGIDSAINLMHRHLFKMHRVGFASDTSVMDNMCQPVKTMWLKKQLYKQNMIYPIPQIRKGYGIGVPSTVWGAGREFPVGGEDYGFLLWRKKLCCIW